MQVARPDPALRQSQSKMGGGGGLRVAPLRSSKRLNPALWLLVEVVERGWRMRVPTRQKQCNQQISMP